MRLSLVLALGLTLSHPAAADPITIRLATLAPDGTSWARELRAASRDLDAQTHGQVRMKWYFGGIAGDESVVPDRIRRGQLEGEAAGITCATMAPSLEVLRIAGLFRRRDEAHAIIGRLRPRIEAEMRKLGYVVMAVQWFGSDIVFTRQPVHSLAELRRMKLWIWNLDPVWKAQAKMLGLTVVPLSPEAAGGAYDEGRIDGFIAHPTAALAFQWAGRARYYTELPMAMMPSCSIISSQAFDALPLEAQQAMRDVGVKAGLRFEDINAAQEDALLGGLFERQGVTRVPASLAFREELLEQARVVRDALPDSIVSRALVTQVLGWLSDFRAEHP